MLVRLRADWQLEGALRVWRDRTKKKNSLWTHPLCGDWEWEKDTGRMNGDGWRLDLGW